MADTQHEGRSMEGATKRRRLTDGQVRMLKRLALGDRIRTDKNLSAVGRWVVDTDAPREEGEVKPQPLAALLADGLAELVQASGRYYAIYGISAAGRELADTLKPPREEPLTRLQASVLRHLQKGEDVLFYRRGLSWWGWHPRPPTWNGDGPTYRALEARGFIAPEGAPTPHPGYPDRDPVVRYYLTEAGAVMLQDDTARQERRTERWSR